MSALIKRLTGRVGALLCVYLFAVSLTLMYVHTESANPSSAYVLGYTALTAGILLIMGLSKRSVWLTFTALLAAAGTALTIGWTPVSDVRAYLNALNRGELSAYIDQTALAVSILLLIIAWTLNRDRHSIYV